MSIHLKNALFNQRKALAAAQASMRELTAKAQAIMSSEALTPEFKQQEVAKIGATASQELREQSAHIRSLQKELDEKLRSKLPPEASFEERTYYHQRAAHALAGLGSDGIVALYQSTAELPLKREIARIVELTPTAKDPLWLDTLEREQPAPIRAAEAWKKKSSDMLGILDNVADKAKDPRVTVKDMADGVSFLDTLDAPWDRISGEILSAVE